MRDGNDEVEFRGRLAREVDAWQREGLVAGDQARGILARYELAPGAGRVFRLGPLATLISVVGAIALGMGVIYFFAANWELLPVWLKVCIVYAGAATAYGAGYWLQFRRAALPRVGASLILLGALLFQAGIFLLAQIYNMPVESPLALLLGAAGILPLAYAVRSRLVLVLGLADALIWLGWQLIDTFGSSPRSFMVPLMYLLAGIIVYSAGHLHRLREEHDGFAAVYEMLGLAAIFLPAYVLSFGYFWKEAQRSGLSSMEAPIWFTGTVALAIVAAASALLNKDASRGTRFSRTHDPIALAEVALLAIIALLAALVAYMPDWAPGYGAVFNAVFFGLAFFACTRGHLSGEARFVNVGVVALAAGLVTRYVDSFWSLLPMSAFFSIGGLVLLGVAAGLEWLRRHLIEARHAPATGLQEGA